MPTLSAQSTAAGKREHSPAGFIRKAYKILYRAYGPQGWWPAATRFEVIVGAILTQNTSWSNVEKAIANLKAAGALSAASLRRMPSEKLAQLIRPSGYYNQKAIKLKNFLAYFFQNYNGSIKAMAARPMPALREELLAVHGIGPETADSILLYALDKPSFVVDAYTRRILQGHGVIGEKASYHDIRRLFMDALKPDVYVYNEYHALLVRVAKEHYSGRKKTDGNSPLGPLECRPGPHHQQAGRGRPVPENEGN